MRKQTEEKTKKTIKTKGWSQERRQKQSQNCQNTKPWQNATGPKTEAGKQTTRNNAIKHGLNTPAAKKFKQALKDQKKWLKNLNDKMSIKTK